MRLDEAIENATAGRVLAIIRTTWKENASDIRQAPRDVAFELARWACGMASAKAVQHAYDFDRGARKIDF
jgi:hypothetical protein